MTHSEQISDIKFIKESNEKLLKKLSEIEGRVHDERHSYKPDFPVFAESEITEMEHFEVNELTDDGTLYAIWSYYLEKSTDWGATWERISSNDFNGETINQVRKLETGELLVTTGFKIYKSDTNEKNFRLVHQYPDGGGYIYRQFGLQVFGNIIVTGCYGVPDADKITAYLSVDAGDTFEEVFRADEKVGFNHIHDIKFDPYENLIWITLGDGFVGNIKNRIYWSDDFGKSWNVYLGPRITQVIPLPHSVLFVSDEVGRNSVYRYDRPQSGTTSIKDKDISSYIDEVWYAKDNITGTSAYRWGTNAAIVYGQDAKAYFGYKLHGGDENECVATVYATSDGVTFTPIWSRGKIIKESNGISGVFGPDKDGNLAVALREKYNNDEGFEKKLLKLKV